MGYSQGDHRERIVTVMEQTSPAEVLPALYRAILDRVAELEQDGSRAEAASVRATATRAYSKAWDDHARRALEALLRQTAHPGSGETIPSRGIATGRPVTS